MAENSRTNNTNSPIRNEGSRSANLSALTGSINLVKGHVGFAAGVFCLIAILLIVGLWRLTDSSPGAKADASSSPDVSNNVGINSNVNNMGGAAADGSNTGFDVTVQKNGDAPAKVTINGQPVNVPSGGMVNSNGGNNDNNATVQINVSGGQSAGSGGSSHVYSHSSSFVHSDSQSSNLNISSRSGSSSN